MLIYQNNVLDYFDELTYKLFELEYFGFVESSENYIDRIVDFVEENIQNFPKRKTPLKLIRFGRYYIFFKINPRTTWFIFFETNNEDFIVTNIINNHCSEAKYL